MMYEFGACVGSQHLIVAAAVCHLLSCIRCMLLPQFSLDECVGVDETRHSNATSNRYICTISFVGCAICWVFVGARSCVVPAFQLNIHSHDCERMNESAANASTQLVIVNVSRAGNGKNVHGKKKIERN